MFSIPLPFVASLLLLITALLVYQRPHSEKQKALWFILLCALATAVVGLRWTTDITFFRFIQPVLGACLPVAAWACFARAHDAKPLSHTHWLGPVTITVCAFNYPVIWSGLTDILLTALYLGYGLALFFASFNTPKEVRFSNITHAVYAERFAATVLLLSAAVDSAISYDFLVHGAQNTGNILTMSYLVFIPLIVVAVLVVSRGTLPQDSGADSNKQSPLSLSPSPDNQPASADDGSALQIYAQFDRSMRENEWFRDVDLTLSRLARKMGVPARQLSAAVNQVRGENISKVINTYRIDHAKQRLLASDAPITDIYLDAGFLTKSNFHREFSRLTGQTPSEYRRRAQSQHA